MDGIFGHVSPWHKRKLEHCCRFCQDAKLRTRYLVVLNLLKGRSAVDTARALHVGRSTVYRVARRYADEGFDGLIDRREDNGPDKLNDQYLAALWDVVASSPLEHGWRRPTWTREMLVLTLRKLVRVKVHVWTMSVALAKIGARRGRPKPTVESPWSKRAKNQRLREIRMLIDELPRDEVAFYEDEVDIHLNPKIGADWMVCGPQKSVITPAVGTSFTTSAGQENPCHPGQLFFLSIPRKR